MKFKSAEKMAPGLYMVLDAEGRRFLWASVKLRKEKECAIAGLNMRVGAIVFRPIANVQYRSYRISLLGMETLEQRACATPTPDKR